MESCLRELIAFPSRTKLIEDSRRPQPRYRGLIHGSAQIVKEEGIGGIYRGLLPVVSSLSLSTIRNFAGFYSDTYHTDDATRRKLGRSVHLVLGSEASSSRISGAITAVTIYRHLWHWRHCRYHHCL